MTQVSSNSVPENEVTETNVSSEEDYKLIEGALMQNPRGRWFLEEYIQRNRPEDTQKLLSAIQRIENTLSEKQEAPASQEIDPIRMSIIEMSKAIAKTREEIASIKPNDTEDNQIITATEELSAIVEATENATNTILEAAEEIQEAAWSLREEGASDTPCDKIDEKTTDIYTACSFQDITGQRTTKVVQALCYIENRVNAMIDIWDLEGETSQSNKGPIQENNDTRPDSHLLNGPALKGDGLEQGCVDSMLTEDTSNASETSDQSMVDEMSFDSIDEQSEAVPNTEHMASEDVDAMSFDAIDVETNVSSQEEFEIGDLEAAEPEISVQPELSNDDLSVATEEVAFDVEAPAETNIETESFTAVEQPLEDTASEDLAENMENISLESEEIQSDLGEEANSLEQSINHVENDLAVPAEDNALAIEPEEILATELVTPEINPLDDNQLEGEIALEEPSVSLEPAQLETNPLLQENHDLNDLDVSDFETNLTATTDETPTENCPPLNLMAMEDMQVETVAETSSADMNPAEMDFGDIQITDLESPEMSASEIKEEPITSQDQLNNIEDLDIENLSELQEQILVTE